MPNDIVEREPFDPRKIYRDLIKRCKAVREWYVFCIVDEGWIPTKTLPFEMNIFNGIFICRVFAETYNESLKIINENLPVVKFIDEPDDFEK